MGYYVHRSLNPNEKHVFETRLHWIIYIWGWLIIFVGLLLFMSSSGSAIAIRSPVFGSGIGIIVMGFGLALLIPKMITRWTSEFAVTTKRVVIKVGWIRIKTIELLLSKVESVDVEQGIFGRLLGYGQITVIGIGSSREPFDYIADPDKFRRAVQSLQS